MLKRINRKATGKGKQRIKGFLSYQSYYPDYDMIRTKNGYAKLYHLHDFPAQSRKEYEDKVFDMLVILPESTTQVCHINGNDYLVLTVNRDTPEDAYNYIQSLSLPLKGATLEEWFAAICAITQFSAFEESSLIGAVNKKGKPRGTILPLLQPFKSISESEKGKKMKINETKIVSYNNQYIRTVLLTNFPIHIYPSLMTEIMKISDKIEISSFFRKIDKEKCAYAFENFKFNMSTARTAVMKREICGDKDLINTCTLIMVHDEDKRNVDEILCMVEGTAKKYMANINVMDHQQVQCYRSMVPLGINHMHYNKVLYREDLIGLMPLSWSKHVGNTMIYGNDANNNSIIYYNRLLTRENGFFLGSDFEMVQKRILNEINEFKKADPTIIIELYTLDSSTCELLAHNFPVISFVPRLFVGNQGSAWEADWEALRLVSIQLCGNNGILSNEKMALINEAYQESDDFYGFLSKIKQKNPAMGRQFDMLLKQGNEFRKPEDHQVTIIQCGNKGSLHAEKIGYLFQGLTKTKADVVYVLSAEAFGDSDLLHLLELKHPHTIFSWCSIRKEEERYHEFYLSDAVAKSIQASHFLDISSHNAIDRILLCEILEFDKYQKSVLASEGELGILIAEDIMCIYHGETETGGKLWIDN